MNDELIPGKLYLFKKQDLYNWYINDSNRLLFLQEPRKFNICRHLVFLKKEKLNKCYDLSFLHGNSIIKRFHYSSDGISFSLKYWVVNNG